MDISYQKDLPKVLFVDDDPVVTRFINTALSKFQTSFSPITAKDGLEAIQILNQQKISAIVTDLNMPNMDGTSLLAHVAKAHPGLPCAVLTSGSMDERIDCNQILSFVEKPIDASTIYAVVNDLLYYQKQMKGSISGISLTNFLQIIESEKKSGTIEILTSDKEIGHFYISQGELLDAKFGKKVGVEAAMEILPKAIDQISIHRLPKPAPRQVIKESIMSLLMEALHIEDERAREGVETSFNTLEFEEFPDGADSVSSMADPQMRMLLKPISSLRSSEGFMGVCVKDSFGHHWYSKSDSEFIDSETMREFLQIITFNGNRLENERLGPTDEVIWTTEKAVLIIRQTPVLGNTRLRVLLAIAPGPHQNMMRTKLKHTLSSALPEILHSKSFLEN